MRMVKPIEAIYHDGRVKQCPRQEFRILDDWLKMRAESGTHAYVVELADPAGWGACFVREEGDILKEYADKDTARVAARISR